MPNRVLKESIKSNDQIDSLTWFEEVVYYRLLVTADDYGIMDARPTLLKNALFPLKDSVTRKSIEDAVSKLASVGLLRTYEVSGKPYVLFPTWEKHQRIRNHRSKYPMPAENGLSDNCQSIDSQLSDNWRPESESNPNPESESKRKKEKRAREDPIDMDSPWVCFAKQYEQNIGLIPTSTVEREDLLMFFEEYGLDVLTEFIRMTARKHVDNPHSYFAAICRHYLGKGIRTAEQAQAAIMDYERGKKGGARNGVSRGSAAESPRKLYDGETVV